MPNKSNKKIFLNADDVGISTGVNHAITNAITKGALRSISIIVNLPHSIDGIRIAKSYPEVNNGIHINLTLGQAISEPKDIPLLVNSVGKFTHGFLGLLVTSVLHKKDLQTQVKIEAQNQINKLRSEGILIEHIDSHRHIHMIPALFTVMQQLAAANNIKRIRFINERFFATAIREKSSRYFFDGSFIKFLVLKFLASFIRYPTTTYFYSILFTGKMNKERVKKVFTPDPYTETEIMIHPGMINLDKRSSVISKYVLSDNRQTEYETTMDKTLFNA